MWCLCTSCLWLLLLLLQQKYTTLHIDALYPIAFQESKHLKMFIAETKTFGFQNVFAHAVFVFQKCLFITKSSKRGKAVVVTTTIFAKRTLHAIGKNYAIKTIPAGKILERN